MPPIAKVVLDTYLDKALDYSIPLHLSERVAIGSRVRVPLKNRSVLGIVTGFSDESQIANLKPILEVLGERPLVPPILLRLAEWMASYYLCSLDAAIRAVLPHAIRSEKIAPQTIKIVKLIQNLSADEIETLSKRAPKQAQVVQTLLTQPEKEISVKKLEEEVGKCHQLLRSLQSAGIIKLVETPIQRDPYGNEQFLQTSQLVLNSEQEKALREILHAVENPATTKPILLHGVTGSGKTEVYLQIVELVLHLGKTAIILIPEISLAPQTVERFKSRFAHLQKEVAVLHSNLSEGQRYDEWFKIQTGAARVVIGARSAIFAPIQNLGIIIVDEEHDTSYKQEETPKYHARDMAVVRSRLEPCAILLGSATPSAESYYNVTIGKYTLLELPHRVDGKKLPIIRIIDMKIQNKKAGSVQGVLSPQLAEAIQNRLDKREQIILFLNRRGHSTSLQCPTCGYVEMCTECSVAMTYHRQDEKLVCHICGQTKRAPKQCAKCGDKGILFFGVGTQKIEEIIRQRFPDARIQRMDSDSMASRDAHRTALSKFRARQIDILIGTQMIAKGLDFPGVTLVGIINADLALYLPDFRASERTFQLLTQVAGRAGRGDVEGEVLVQTYSPENPAIQFARHHDFQGFWEQENEFRRQFGHPPYSRLFLLTLRGKKENLVEFTAKTLRKKLQDGLPAGCFLGESISAPLSKAKGQYRFQILLRSPKNSSALSVHIRNVVANFPLPQEIILSIDVDPYNLL